MDIPNPTPGNRREWMEAATSPMMLGLILGKHYRFRGLEGQEFTPYPHIQELDRILVALCDGQLYESGPGPPPFIEARYRPIGSNENVKKGLRTVVHTDWFDTTDNGELIDKNEWVLHDSKAFHPERKGEEVIQRLGVFLPIRHGKSLMCSVLLPVWYVLQNTATSVMIVGHTKDFGQGELGRRVQTFLNNFMKPMGLVPADNKLGRDKMNFRYDTSISTIMFSGVDVGVLGMAKRLGVLDDPVKSMKDMESEPFRYRQYQFFADEWLGRATLVPGQPPPVDVNVMSRIGMDDIAGKFIIEPGTIDQPQKGYYVLHRQGLVKDDFGEHSLCEQMVPTKRLLESREKTPESFQSQYQNDPRPVQGLGFKAVDEWPQYRLITSVYSDFPTYTIVGDKDEQLINPDIRFATIDLSGKRTNTSDYTVVIVFDYSLEYDILFLRNLTRMRVDAADHMNTIKEFCDIPGEKKVDYAVTENISMSWYLLQSAERDSNFLGFDLWPSNRKTAGPSALSKTQRFRIAADAVDNNKIILPHNNFELHWWLDFKKEVEAWPKVSYDDQLDALADGVFEIGRIRENHVLDLPDPDPPQIAQENKYVYHAQEQEHYEQILERINEDKYNPLGEHYNQLGW